MSDIQESGKIKLELAEKLLNNIEKANLEQIMLFPRYRYKYTTGPFCLPQSTHSLDWGILNNDSSSQKVRVTVFKCHLMSTKSIEPPGPLIVSLKPGETTHNANRATGGFFYEIQVECNSKLIFPYAAAWPSGIGDPIAGSVVKSAEFILQMS
ncbi:hypothetical protein [Candidatus Hodarchaeum mangrovi]